jgi:hypothetical protein
LFHKTAIADHIGCEDRGEPTFHANPLKSAPDLNPNGSGLVQCYRVVEAGSSPGWWHSPPR